MKLNALLFLTFNNYKNLKINYNVYRRSYSINCQADNLCETRQLVVVNTLIRPSWKQTLTQSYSCRQVYSSRGCFSSTTLFSRNTKKASISRKRVCFSDFRRFVSKSSRHFSSRNGEVTHSTRKFLPFVSYLVSSTHPEIVSFSNNYDRNCQISLNTRREKARKERILFLKTASNLFFKNSQSLKKSSRKKFDKLYLKEQGALPVQTKNKIALKSVWKGFTNTFMRNGAKLRYQTMLRRALLAL